MAIDAFLKIEGVTGEAQDKVHKDEIDVLSWSWGGTQSGTTHTGQGSGGGKVAVQDMSFTKYTDKSSPTLWARLADGKHFEKALLCVRKAGGDSPLEYMKIEMTEVLVSSMSTGGSGGEDRLTENITLNFGKFKVTYTPQKPDGSPDTPIETGWDIAANVKI